MKTPLPLVLIGTPETVRSMRAQLALLPDTRGETPCVLIEPPSAGEPLPACLGTIDQMPRIQERHRFGTALVCLPTARATEAVRVRAVLATLNIRERSIPSITDALAGAATPSRVEVDTAELVGRTPYGIDRRSVARSIDGRRVLITGAGGSIGSELVRIVATFHPENVILVERSENALFEIDRQMARRFPGIARRAVMHDVVDADRTLRLLQDLRPHVVFHAAAHKHVPLMEDHPSHAVENNFFGTKSIADAALAVGTERFVMISSDKAVNPTSVMGATKRLAEMYVGALRDRVASRAGATRVCMVRFGNVLGSACSVLPIWSQQIAEGGPVTVTDERMTRYFMTIHEAAMLVIQAAAMCPDAGAAPVYVLDMGEPVRILDLARRFVAAHGLEPVLRSVGEVSGAGGAGLEITLTGIRPGEKLHEELAYAAEQLSPTEHPGINAWIGTDRAEQAGPKRFGATELSGALAGVRGGASRAEVLRAIARFVPTLPIGDEPELRTIPIPSTGEQSRSRAA